MKQNCPVYKKRQADNATNDKVGELLANPPIPKVHDTDKVVTAVNAVTIGVEEDWDQDYNEFSGAPHPEDVRGPSQPLVPTDRQSVNSKCFQ